VQGGLEPDRDVVAAARRGQFDVDFSTIGVVEAQKPIVVKRRRKARIPDALVRRREGLLGLIVVEVEFDLLGDGRLLGIAVGLLFRDGRDVEIEIRVLLGRNRHHERDPVGPRD